MFAMNSELYLFTAIFPFFRIYHRARVKHGYHERVLRVEAFSVQRCPEIGAMSFEDRLCKRQKTSGIETFRPNFIVFHK